MISLSNLLATGAENPVKSAAFAVPEGLFANILLGETGTAELQGGKILPEGGKSLPDGLPRELFALPKSGKAPLADLEAAIPAGDGLPEEAAVLETEAVEAPVAPTGSQVIEVIALVAAAPLNLDPAPLAPPPPPAPSNAPAEDTAEGVPAQTPGRKPVVGFPMLFPGAVRAPEEAPAEVQAKPALRLSGHTAPALLAALVRRDAQPEAKPAGTEPAPAPQPLATAAASVPAILQDAVRQSRPARPQARREVTLELAKEVKAPAEQAAKSAAPASTLTFAPAAQPVSADASLPAQGARPAAEFAGQQQAVRPHEFAALVDRLVEARETVRPANASLTVTHAEFGQVSVRFGQDNGNLTVSLASSDPGFMPAVNAAVAADASANGDAGLQHSRREDGGQPASSRGTDNNGATGERGTGRDSAGRQAREDDIKHQPRHADHTGRDTRGGIFA